METPAAKAIWIQRVKMLHCDLQCTTTAIISVNQIIKKKTICIKIRYRRQWAKFIDGAIPCELMELQEG